jgi:hypothetical protein
VKSHVSKRAKEEAAHANNQESPSNEISIKREKLSPGSSPNSIHRTNDDKVQLSNPLSIPHFTLPQEVTIHVRLTFLSLLGNSETKFLFKVTSNGNNLPVSIQLPQLMTTTAPDGTTETTIVKMPTSS